MTSEERKERVEELIDNSVYAFVTDLMQRQKMIKNIANRIDSLYADREKQLTEALEWACRMLDAHICQFVDDTNKEKCDGCPVKQALEGK